MGARFSDFANFRAYNEGVLLGQLCLILLFEVKCATVVFGITMLAAEYKFTFTRESEEANLLLAGPACVLVRLH